MRDERERSWLAERLETAVYEAMQKAFRSMRVDAGQYLAELRLEHGVAVESYGGMFRVPLQELDQIAGQTLRGAMKMAGAEGAGMGLGGMATVIPDMGVLSVITLRMVQKMSLIYGFEYNTEEEAAELWIAAASAAGVDLGRELLERTVLRGLVERLARRIAARVGAELAEKFALRAVPVVSSAVGAALNYYFVKAWGRRAMAHFRQRHLLERERRARREAIPLPASGAEAAGCAEQDCSPRSE